MFSSFKIMSFILFPLIYFYSKTSQLFVICVLCGFQTCGVRPILLG